MEASVSYRQLISVLEATSSCGFFRLWYLLHGSLLLPGQQGESLQCVCQESSDMYSSITVGATSQHLCHILLVKSKLQVPLTL